MLKNEFKYIPQVVDEVANLYLFMMPVGGSIVRLDNLHICEVIRLLEAVHKIGYVRRDIRLSNLLVHSNNILLIDCGCAVTQGTTLFSGTTHYAAYEILEGFNIL